MAGRCVFESFARILQIWPVYCLTLYRRWRPSSEGVPAAVLWGAPQPIRLTRRAPLGNSPWPLPVIKNAAYAWRQAVFFLSICGDDTAADALRDLPGATTWPATRILEDLTRCLQGEPVTPFTDWTQGPHWVQSTVPETDPPQAG